MTADPRVEPEARVLNSMNYEEVFQMADKGAKVIHPRAVEIAKSGGITLESLLLLPRLSPAALPTP